MAAKRTAKRKTATKKKATAKRSTTRTAKKATSKRKTTTAKRKPAAKKATAKRKTTARKTTARKPAAKKATAKRAPAKKAAPKKLPTSSITSKLPKSQLFSMIAEDTDLSKKEIGAVFDSLSNIIDRSVRKRAAGEFTLPGLCKIKVVRKPATKARRGINPFTGEETTFKAKPARNVVKVRPLKKLKEMAE